MKEAPRIVWLWCDICGAWWLSAKKAHRCDLDDQVRRALFTGYEHLLLHASESVETEMRRVVGVRRGQKLKPGQPDPNELAVIPAVANLGRQWCRLVKRLWRAK